MRTKITILSAAALAAGLISSNAQVFSANIVGYANIPVKAGYSFLVNPFSTGVTNGANEVMPIESTPNFDGSYFLTWTGTTFKYNGFDSGSGGWIDQNFNPAPPPVIPPGKGFFFFNPGVSNLVTFVGTVIPNVGATNSLPIPSGYSMVGSVVPVAGSVTNPVVNMPVVDGFYMLQWNGTTYVYTGFDSGSGGWIDANFNPAAVPSLKIGEGFFYNNPDVPTTWKQSLP
jgi:hypothetical protein